MRRTVIGMLATVSVLALANQGHAQAAKLPALTPGVAKGEPTRSMLLGACPSDTQVEVRSFLWDLLGGVVKFGFVKTAGAITSYAKKQNDKLNHVVSYDGFGRLYMGEAGGKPSNPAQCLVLIRFDGKTPASAAFNTKLANFLAVPGNAEAAQTLGLKRPAVAPNTVPTPAFYAELRLASFNLPTSSGTGAAGYTVKPNYVFFGNTAAERWGKKQQKTLRVELELKRLTDTGALADKPYYAAGFNLGDFQPGQDATTFPDAAAGPPALYPAPKELKTQLVFNDHGDALAAPPLDVVPTAITAKVIEAEEPSFLNKLLDQLSADQEDEIKKAAEAAAAAVVAGLKD